MYTEEMLINNKVKKASAKLRLMTHALVQTLLLAVYFENNKRNKCKFIENPGRKYFQGRKGQKCTVYLDL